MRSQQVGHRVSKHDENVLIMRMRGERPTITPKKIEKPETTPIVIVAKVTCKDLSPHGKAHKNTKV
jgi:hypothetical protein